MDLTTNYLGLTLKSPLVPSSSPLTRNLAHLRSMEDAGAAAVVLYSLFEEEILSASHNLDQYLSSGSESYAEALSYFPEAPSYINVGPEAYLTMVAKAKAALDIPVIASLNGVSAGNWVGYAREIEKAGADALELNIYFLPTDLMMSGAEVEKTYLDLVKDVRATITIPLAVKLSPYFSGMAHMAGQLSESGANGLVLFNRFYQPDIDLDDLSVEPRLVLSQPEEMRLPLRWIAILYGRLQADLALTTGVHSGKDALKGIAAGAAVTMVASELLQNGIGRLTEMTMEMTQWLVENEYESLAQLRGSLSQINCPAPAAFERANYMKLVGSYSPETAVYFK